MKQIKGKFIKAISWKTTPCICIRNITEHYDEEFLMNYFENTKRSGGGEVLSVELFGNGEAKVMFKDLKGIFYRCHMLCGAYSRYNCVYVAHSNVHIFQTNIYNEGTIKYSTVKINP